MRAVFLFMIMLIVSCNNPDHSNGSSQPHHDSVYADSVAKSEAEELNNPHHFLEIDAEYEKNLLGQWIVKGRVTCNSTMVMYKAVVLKITYYNKEKLSLGSVEKTIEENFAPGTSHEFDFTVEGLPNTDSIGVSIISAYNVI
jgi:hypothetical protein